MRNDEHLRLLLCYTRKHFLLELKEAISGCTFHCRGRIHSSIYDSKAIDMAKENAE
jgi:hypothetical protein